MYPLFEATADCNEVKIKGDQQVFRNFNWFLYWCWSIGLFESIEVFYLLTILLHSMMDANVTAQNMI